MIRLTCFTCCLWGVSIQPSVSCLILTCLTVVSFIPASESFQRLSSRLLYKRADRDVRALKLMRAFKKARELSISIKIFLGSAELPIRLMRGEKEKRIRCDNRVTYQGTNRITRRANKKKNKEEDKQTADWQTRNLSMRERERMAVLAKVFPPNQRGGGMRRLFSPVRPRQA